MLDDKDEFVCDWTHYTCPGCGGYREAGCSTCAEYEFFYDLVLRETLDRARQTQAVAAIQDVHVEVLRRMEVAA